MTQDNDGWNLGPGQIIEPDDWPRPGSTVHAVSGSTYPKKRRRVWPWLAALVGISVVLVLIACANPGANDTDQPVDSNGHTLLPDIGSRPVDDPKPGQITEGVWPVGEKKAVKPGTYDVTKELPGGEVLCYWQISTDAAGKDIVANDVPGGGVPQVNLEEGQWFKSQGCGTWKRVVTIHDDGGSVRTTYYTNTLPSAWPVTSAVKLIDKYTGSRWVKVKTCPKTAWRCIQIKAGARPGGKDGVIGTAIWKSTGVSQVIIDVKDAKKSGQFGPATRKWLLVHEIAHTAGLKHRAACTTALYQYRRCLNGKVPPVTFDAAQRKTLRTR